LWLLLFPDNLLQDGGILNFLISRAKQNPGDHFRRAWIVIGKRQEEPAAMIGVVIRRLTQPKAKGKPGSEST
jgi:hypothetical protein